MPLNISGSIVNAGIAKTLNYSSIVTRGLVLQMDAGALDSYPETGTVWFDRINTATSGSLTNGPVFSSDNGGSIIFDGSNDNCPTSFTQPTTQMTLGVWVKTSNTTQSKTLLSKWGSSALNNFSWLLFTNFFGQGNIYFLIGNAAGNSYETFSGAHTLSSGVYAYFSITYNAGAVVLYKNGSQIGSDTSSFTSLRSISTPFTIASDWDTGSGTESIVRPFDGTFGTVHVYNRALSAAELTQNYNAQKSRFGL